TAQVARNEKFLTVPANLDTYIEKALRPILDAVGSHPAIMCWEVFNEPEGMATGLGWASRKIDHSHIMRFTNKIAGEVHRKTKKMASTGIHNFSSGERSLYSDAKLKAAGGDDDGYLDFYMAHYYPQYGGTSESPFHHPASYWGFDRPVLIGEFPAQGWPTAGQGYTIQSGTDMTIIGAYEYAYNNGYCGAMSWSMTEGDKAKFGSFETTKPALENLYAKHKTDIEIKDVDIDVPTGDLAMKVVFDGLAPGDANEVLLKREGSLNINGKTNLTFEIFIDQQSGSNLVLYPAIQTASDWGWYTTGAPINLGSYEKGKWVSVEVPLASLKKDGTGAALASTASVYAVFFKFITSNTSSFSGTVYFDNVAIDNDVFSNFNEMASEWNIADGEVSVSLVKRPAGSSAVINGVNSFGMSGRAPVVTVNGKMLNVTGIGSANMQIKMINVKGKTVAKFKASGSGQFSIAKIPAGRYFVETKAAGKLVSASAVTVR
ncbi:MAG: T9SS type A sorting domain-containing protein, partial [Chitinispirillales bacterium]|nr:T9SS type A sorting domain-containing protein [Chitinispirillales bacterium]